jgi:hypothetical protein
MAGVPGIFLLGRRQEDRQVGECLVVTRPYLTSPFQICRHSIEWVHSQGCMQIHHVVLEACGCAGLHPDVIAGFGVAIRNAVLPQQDMPLNWNFAAMIGPKKGLVTSVLPHKFQPNWLRPKISAVRSPFHIPNEPFKTRHLNFFMNEGPSLSDPG